MKNKKHVFILLALLSAFRVLNAQTALTTMSDVNNFFEDVQFMTLLEIKIQEGESSGVLSKNCFSQIGNYIDLNVIGKGRTLVMSETKMSQFIIAQINSGATADELSKKLLVSFLNNEFTPETNTEIPLANEKMKVTVGGYFVSEFEYHQEPDGSYHPLLEINQTRIYVGADINHAAKKNKVSFLSEWNPIPEEVIHQIDTVAFTRDSTKYTLKNPHLHGAVMEGTELIPFERLYVRIHKLAGTKLNFKAGQFRIPFGIWSDYTSHRNFTSTKNNLLVNGFALKKIDLGIMLDMDLANGLEWQAAIVHGRLGRTSGFGRADLDDKKDFVAHAGYNHKKFAIGASAYFADLNTHRFASGLDYQLNFKKITVNGEIVYQRNNSPGTIYDMIDGINELSSLSSYVQFNLQLSPKLYLYGMYEIWDFKVDGERVHDPAGKMFHGFRYTINNNFHWVILEYGHMFHKGYDKGTLHFSTQLDLTF